MSRQHGIVRLDPVLKMKMNLCPQGMCWSPRDEGFDAAYADYRCCCHHCFDENSKYLDNGHRLCPTCPYIDENGDILDRDTYD